MAGKQIKRRRLEKTRRKRARKNMIKEHKKQKKRRVKKPERRKSQKPVPKKDEKKISAQKTIAYKEMARDGICRVKDRCYSKTIRFSDINYQLAQNEDKNAIFENWCDF